MAASCVNKSLALSRIFVKHKEIVKASKRFYTIQPPAWLGGKNVLDIHGKFDFPEHSDSFEERMQKLADEKLKNMNGDVYVPKDIGAKISVEGDDSIEKKILQVSAANRVNKELEKASRTHSLIVPLDEVKRDWMIENGAEQIKLMAEHCGIYKDLFGGDYFYPTVNMGIYYDYDKDFLTPVCRGNIISPSEAIKPPLVEIDSQSDELWTLLMVNPDENLTNQEDEYIHWLVANIPGGDISKGEVLVDYFQPIPANGTGYHRNVFVLFQQKKGKMNYEDIKRIKDDVRLDDRNFKTQTFFKNHESELVPRSIAFFQSQWDESVRNYFRTVLSMAEPSFEYDHPTAYHPPPQKYPHKQPFNLYFDRYRDRKDIDEEVLRQKLKETSAFEQRKPEFKYTMYHVIKKHKPSWLVQKEQLMLRRVEQYKNLD